MSKETALEGDPANLLELLMGMIKSTNVDPLFHISELVQNEMDADAGKTDIQIIRSQGSKGKSSRIEKIIISGNGFGFLESFEHYSKNIGNSIKKYVDEYISRNDRGQSRGQFCIGLQGFRAICEEIQIINITEKGRTPKHENGKQIVDPDFPKMYDERKMILNSSNRKMIIQEKEEYSEHRIEHGVTCILLNLKVDIKGNNLSRYLAQNKRRELLANKKLTITVKDGTFSQIVKPIEFDGDKKEFVEIHPRSKNEVKYKGLGEVKATLYFHEPRPGNIIRLDVKGEPMCLNLTELPEFNVPPWNSEIIEGIIEYDRLTKSPLRSGVERDEVFWPAFVDIMVELAHKIESIVKEYEERSKQKSDKKMMEKIERIMQELKRQLDFQTWFSKPIEKPQPGPLDHIDPIPPVANVPAFTTRRVHVRAYDKNNIVLMEKNDIDFSWTVSNNLGNITPMKNGDAIFKAGSTVGTTTLDIKVEDKINGICKDAKIEIVITHPPANAGRLSRVRIEPLFSTLEIGKEKEYLAIAEDDERNPITKNIRFHWVIAYDESKGAKISNDQGESIILTTGNNLGPIKLQVTAYQDNLSRTDYAIITVIEKLRKKGRKIKLKNTGLPTPDYITDSNAFPPWHSKLKIEENVLLINDGHIDYVNADSKGGRYRLRYIALLYAKELAKMEYESNKMNELGEVMLDVLSKLDRLLEQ